MSVYTSPHASLIFIGEDRVDTAPFRRLAEQALADHGETRQPRRPVSDDLDVIAGSECYVRITTGDDTNPRTGKVSGAKLTVTVSAYDADNPDPDRLHGLLANIVTRGLRKTDADLVEWLVPDALMERDEFLEVCSYVSKRRHSRHNGTRVGASERYEAVTDLGTDLVDRLQAEMDDKLSDFDPMLASNQIDGWDPAAMNIARMFRQEATEEELIIVERERDEQLSTPLRLATWAMTGTVATMSLPLAASLSIMSLAKGEDFRLNTQALAISGLMGALSMNGMLNLGSLLGI